MPENQHGGVGGDRHLDLRQALADAQLLDQLLQGGKQGADPEDQDEYRAASIFWVPKEARWAHLKASAPQPTIGKLVDDAMTAIERDNPSLKGVLPKDFARPVTVCQPKRAAPQSLAK